MNHVMVDLETMGTRAGCAIASIGAVKFDPAIDPDGQTITMPTHRFYTVIDLQTCFQAGLRIEASTLYWWLKQSDKARQALLENKAPLGTALELFTRWVGTSRLIWGHGASFDQPILEAAYKAAKLNLPWEYGGVRDTRTIFDLAKVKTKRDPETHHHALADAEAQARAVLEAYKVLGKR